MISAVLRVTTFPGVCHFIRALIVPYDISLLGMYVCVCVCVCECVCVGEGGV